MTFAEIERTIDRYDAATSALDTAVTDRISASMDAAFRQMIRELERQYPTWQSQGSLFASQRRLLLLNELGPLLAIVRPEDAAEYERLMAEALQLSHTTGATLADELVRVRDPGYPLQDFATIPIEAAVAQARDGVGRLYRYDEEFRAAASGIVEVGLIQGFGTKKVQSLLEKELGVAKSKAETLSRTEIMSALNTASQERYQRNGIEYAQWFTSPSDRMCSWCLAREGNVYKVGEARVPAHPRCLPGDAVILSPTIKAGTSRQYSGEVISLETASGKKLTATPNHPVFTDKGWIALNLVKEGDHVFSCVDSEQVVRAVSPDDYQGPALISKIVASLGEPSGVPSVSVKVAPIDFHGDGGDSDVCVIRSNGFLRGDSAPQPRQVINHHPLMARLIGALGFFPKGLSAFLLKGQGAASHCGMCGGDLSLSGFGTHPLPLDPLGLGRTPSLNTGILKNLANSQAGSTSSPRDTFLALARLVGLANVNPDLRMPLPKSLPELTGFDGFNFGGAPPQPAALNGTHENTGIDTEKLASVLNRFTGEIRLDRVIKSTVSHFNGPVYNLETVTGWYFANSILTHNCRCYVAPWSPRWQERGLTDDAAIAAEKTARIAEMQALGTAPNAGPTYWEKKAGLTAAPAPVWKPGDAVFDDRR